MKTDHRLLTIDNGPVQKKSMVHGPWSMVFAIGLFFSLYFILLLPRPVYAEKPIKMVFIYPGGEGSADDAQPYLDRLFAVIHDNKGPEVRGKYYQTAEEGLKALRGGKVQAGIVSMDFYLEKRNTLPMEILLTTLPLAGNGATEQYAVVTEKKTSSLRQSGIGELYSSRNLPIQMVQSVLFGELSDEFAAVRVVAGQKIIPQLKRIANGEIQAAALLDSFEFASLRKMNTDWSRNLKALFNSSAVPSSPVVIFTPLKEETKMKLALAMLKISSTKEGREILENLRLRGFDKPNVELYNQAFTAFSKQVKAVPKMPASSPN